MRKWSKKAAATIFLAAMSVYPVGAFSAEPGKDTNNTEVKLLEEQVASKDAGAGAAAPADAAPATQPSEGQSVDNSQVNVSDAGTVEIHVNEANLVEVLRMLSLQSQKNIIASKDVRGTVTANLYNVTIKEALDSILKANGYGYREKGNFIYVYTQKELQDMEKAERQVTTEVFRLHYSNAQNASTMIKPALSTDAVVSFTVAAEKGIGPGGTDAGGNSHATDDIIVVRDYPENIERVRKIMQEIDRRPQQVLVEATIMAARLSDNNSLGVDFNFLGGIDFQQIIHNNGQLTGAKLPDGENAFRIGDRMSSTGTGNNFTSPLKAGFKFGLVSENVSVFVNALEEIADTAVLANPKVLTLNKQKGEVLVGREDGYLTTTLTDTSAVQTVEFLQTGTRLVFRPYIGDDGYIRMEVHPEDSDGKVVAGLPSKTTTEVTTNIMVKDGHTIVIGGLFRESSVTSRSQVPVLGNLPIVGALFRNQVDQSSREEIIILLTPHIIKDDAAIEAKADALAKDYERMRVGVRRGMMPWGRERLAESCYEAAVDEMKKAEPNRKRALWHLDCATNLNPKLLEAIKMKESLTGKELSTSDNSSIRNFVKKLVLEERMPARADVAEEMTTEPEVAEFESDEAMIDGEPTEAPIDFVSPEEAMAEEAFWLEEEYGIPAEFVTGEAVPTTQPVVSTEDQAKPAVTEVEIEELVPELPDQPEDPATLDESDIPTQPEPAADPQTDNE